jgi:AraC-like DNA-binding protein
VQTLWQVSSYFVGQTISPRAAYWYDNRDRQPFGLIVFQIVEQGQLIWREAGREQVVGPGHAVLFSYGEPTSYGLPTGPRPVYKTTFINFTGAGITEHWQHIRGRHGSIIRPDRQTLGNVQSLITSAKAGSAVDPLQQSRLVHGFMLDLIDSLEGQAQGNESAVEQAIRWILSRPTQEWSLKQVAARFDCSREHLIRVFCRQQGKTPGQFVSEARLRRALSLLVETDLSLSEVASQSGYGSTHTMARQVAQATGSSPSHYRKLRVGRRG